MLLSMGLAMAGGAAFALYAQGSVPPNHNPTACASGTNTAADYCIPTNYSHDFTAQIAREDRIISGPEAAAQPPVPAAAAPAPAPSAPQPTPALAVAPVASPVPPVANAMPATVQALAPVAKVEVSPTASWVGRFLDKYITAASNEPSPTAPVASGEANQPNSGPVWNANGDDWRMVAFGYKDISPGSLTMPYRRCAVYNVSGQNSGLASPFAALGAGWNGVVFSASGLPVDVSTVFGIVPEESALPFTPFMGHGRFGGILVQDIIARMLRNVVDGPDMTDDAAEAATEARTLLGDSAPLSQKKTVLTFDKALPRNAWMCDMQRITEANQDLVQSMCLQFVPIGGQAVGSRIVCD